MPHNIAPPGLWAEWSVGHRALPHGRPQPYRKALSIRPLYRSTVRLTRLRGFPNGLVYDSLSLYQIEGEGQ